jgi:hypothetical protein
MKTKQIYLCGQVFGICVLLLFVNAQHAFSQVSEKSLHKKWPLSNLTTLFTIPINQQSVLKVERENNAEFPEDIQFFEDKLYILSGEEKKVIVYNLFEKKVTDLEKISRRLQQENDEDTPNRPIYLRIVDRHFVIAYDFKVLFFDMDGTFVKKIVLDNALHFITFRATFIFLWFDNNVSAIDLSNKYETNIIPLNDNKIDYTSFFVSYQSEMVSETQACNVNSSQGKFSIVLRKPNSIEFSKYPNLNLENSSVNCVTEKNYIWYPWPIGNQIFLIDKQFGTFHVVTFDENIAKGCLTYPEDRSSGLRMINNGEANLYMMVMKKERGSKRIIVYDLSIK